MIFYQSNKVVPNLLNRHDDAWNSFYNQEYDESFAHLHRFYTYYHNYKDLIDVNKFLNKSIVTSCDLLFKNLYYLEQKNEVGFFQLPDNNGILYYLKHEDSNEVSDFYGQLYLPNYLEIKHIFNYIQSFINNYEKSDEEIEVVLCLSDTKFNTEKIEFDVYYQNEGTIHVELFKDGKFKGDSLFLLTDEGEECVDDFQQKINDIYRHLSSNYNAN